MELSADEVLNAIAAARDVDIEYARIRGDLNIMKVAGRVQQEDGKPVIKGDIGIRFSHLTGGVAFSSATFNGSASFISISFDGDADFSHVTFSGDAVFTNLWLDLR